MTQTTEATYRFSGHQTFALRIAWIPKAVAEIIQGRDPLSNPDDGIQHLGLGKNMVDALRCWIEAYQIARREDGAWKLTPIGEFVFGSNGVDPYLDDPSTPWLLHWLIATNRQSPFWAWECLFNRWPSKDFHASSVMDAFRRHAEQNEKQASDVTLKQHWEVFLHTYLPPRQRNGEDNLDSALSVLHLIRVSGERPNATERWETLYSFDDGFKMGLCQELFAFFIHDWWNKSFANEETVPFRELISGSLSPGRILKMQESDIMQRLNDLAKHHPKVFAITESANLRQLRRLRPSDGLDYLRTAYTNPRFLVT